MLSLVALETRSVFRSSLKIFCDALLRPILQKALSYLPPCDSLLTPLSLTPEVIYITAASLRLVITVMSSDFSGTQGISDGDEVELIQLPSDWDTTICNERVLFSFFSLYHTQSLQLAQLALEAVLMFTAVRRSLFVSPQQTLSFYHVVVQGMNAILQQRAHLDDPTCHSLFAQCLAKMKTNIQLGELIKYPEFPVFFKSLSVFAADTLVSSGYFTDFPYILLFWSRIVEAMRFTNAPVTSVIPQIEMDSSIDTVIRAFVQSFASNRAMWENELENPLDNLELLQKYEEKLGILLTYRYEAVWGIVRDLMTGQLSVFNRLVQEMGNGPCSEEMKENAHCVDSGS